MRRMRKDMLDGVDIKLDGELLFLGLVLTSDTGLATVPGVTTGLDWPLLTREGAGEGGLVPHPFALLLSPSLAFPSAFVSLLLPPLEYPPSTRTRSERSRPFLE